MNQEVKSIANTTIAGEAMELLAEKAIHLPKYDVLLIADLHFGKVEHFRKNGIGIPKGASEKDFETLQRLVHKVGARQVVFLGDLFHSTFNQAWDRFQDVIKRMSEFSFHLIVGNHDILEASKYTNLTVTHQMELGNLILTHEPLDVVVEEKYNLCGHIHPAVKLRGKGKQYLRLPCFYFGKHTGILPAFGSFTGLHALKPMEGDTIFVVNGEVVMKVS